MLYVFVISQCLLFLHWRWKWEKLFIFIQCSCKCCLWDKINSQAYREADEAWKQLKWFLLMLLMFWVLSYIWCRQICLSVLCAVQYTEKTVHACSFNCIFVKSYFLWVKRSVYCLCHSSQCVYWTIKPVTGEMPACEFYVHLQLCNASPKSVNFF